MRRQPLAVVVLVVIVLLASCQNASPPRPSEATGAPIAVRLITINDLHGYLEPTQYHYSAGKGAASAEPLAGGIVGLAGTVERLRAEQPNSVMVASGDLIGASPLSSQLLRDEPTVTALNRMGLKLSAVGNHEFDYGVAELQRIQHGGCPKAGCAQGEKPFAGAKFDYLAANLFDAKSGRRAYPAYRIEQIGGARIAFVGAVLRSAPEIIIPTNIEGLRFADEAESINALVPEIRAKGVRAIVVLIHEGAVPKGPVDPATCDGLQGPILDIMHRLDPEIDVVASAHSHREYICRFEGRLLTQGGSYGHLVTRIDLAIDRHSGDVVSAQAENVLVDPAKPSRDPAFAALVADARKRTDPIAAQPVARLGVEQIRRSHDANGESPLGRFLADVQLETAQKLGAQVACMNPGGVRQNLPPVPRPGQPLTYADVQAVQPFGNHLIVVDLTGAEIKAVLEHQWRGASSSGMLTCSRGFSYRFDESRPAGQRVLDGSIMLDQKPIDPAAHYRISLNNFLTTGGDGYPALKTAKQFGDAGVDLDALIAYLKAHEPAMPPTDVRAQGKFGGSGD